MRRIGFLIVGLLMTVASTVLAQSPAMTITPNSIARNQSLNIEATGLQPGTSYRLDVLYVPSNAVVYSTDRSSDANGVLTFGLRSDASDALGEYRVQLRSGNSLVVEAPFSLIEDSATPVPSTPLPQSTPVPSTPLPPAPTVAPPVTGSRTVDVRVIPNSAQPRSTFNILISGLNPVEVVYVVVVFQADGVTEYDRQWVAGDNGSLTVELFTTANNLPGVYDVRVENAQRQTIVQTTFSVEGVDLNAEVSVSPMGGVAGTAFEISVTGARPFRDVELSLVDAITQTALYEAIVRTNVDGDATTAYTSDADIAEGTYTLIAIESGSEVARASITIGANVFDPSGVSVVVNPPDGALGRTVTVSANRLPANMAVTVNILANGNAFKTFDVQTNGGGAVSITFRTETGDPLGAYTAQIVLDGQVVSEAGFSVLEARVPVVSITPSEGSRGMTHNVTASGLEPNQAVTFEVVFADSVIFTSEKNADADGNAVLILVTDETDGTGDYTVRALVGGRSVGQGVFAVTDGTTTVQPTPAPVTATPVPTIVTASDGINEVITGELTLESPEYLYEFTGKEGEVVSISLKSNDFDAYLSLLDQDGNELIFSDDDGESLDALLSVFVLPYSGSYSVVATSYENAYDYSEDLTGDFTFTFSRVVTSRIAYDTPTSISMMSTQNVHYFTLSATVGDVFGIEVTGDAAVDSTLAIYDFTGTELVFDDDGGSGYHPEIVRFVATETADYLVVLRALSGSGDGNLTLNIQRGEPNTLEQPRTLLLSGKQNSDVLVLEAEAGQIVEITLTVKSGSVSSLSVIASQDGETLMQYSTSYGMAGTMTLSFGVPESGIVNLQVENFGAGMSLEVGVR